MMRAIRRFQARQASRLALKRLAARIGSRVVRVQGAVHAYRLFGRKDIALGEYLLSSLTNELERNERDLRSMNLLEERLANR